MNKHEKSERNTFKIAKKLFVCLALVSVFVASIVASACSFGSCSNRKLSSIYRKYFKTGAMVFINEEADDKLGYPDKILKEFNSFTAENEMKWKYTEPNAGEFTFEKGDILCEKAKKLGAKVRGHALFWHESVPTYLSAKSTKSGVLDAIESHVTETVSHFANKFGDTVYCWDVVNEAISDSSKSDIIYRSGKSGDSQKSPIYDIFDPTGKEKKCPEYIVKAFETARETDKNVKLYYNDYGLINPVKRKKAMIMLQDMLDNDVPIDGVGEQAHYDIRNFDPVAFEEMIEDLTSLEKSDGTHLKLSITELDLSIYDGGSSSGEDEMDPYVSENLFKLQAEVYAKIYEICRKYSKDIESVTTWGVGDDHTWLDKSNRKDYPLLYDFAGEPKLAMQAIKDFKYKVEIDKELKEIDYYNIYDGKKSPSEYHLKNWYTNEETGISSTVNEDDGSTEISFNKKTEYNQAECSVAGYFSDFSYLNFKLSGQTKITSNGQVQSKNVSLEAQIKFNLSESKYDQVIGEEIFEVGKEETIISIKIPSKKTCYMDLIDSVWLFPEPGSKNSATAGGTVTYSGSFTIYDVWFSKELPDDVKKDNILEPSGSSSSVNETALKAVGKDTWYNETTWTNYNISWSKNPDYLVDISSAAQGVAEWGYVSVQLTDVKQTDTQLKFTFVDKMDSKTHKPTVSYIRFRLRGSPTGMFDDGVNSYMKYHDQDLVDWINDGHVTTYNNNGDTTYDDFFTEDYVQSTKGKNKGGANRIDAELTADGIKYTITYDIDTDLTSMFSKGWIDTSSSGYGLRLVILIESLGYSREMDISYSAQYPDDYDENYGTEGMSGETVPYDGRFNISVVEVDTYKPAEPAPAGAGE